jgi:hypothetical protein
MPPGRPIRESTSFAREMLRALDACAEEQSRLHFPSSKYEHDPIGFARDVLGIRFWSRQEDMARALLRGKRIALCSGRKCGKTAFLVATAWWFISSHPNASVYLVTPNEKQGEQILWREFNRQFRAAGRCVECRETNPGCPVPCPHSALLGGRLSPNSEGGWRSDDGLRTIERMSLQKRQGDTAGMSGKWQLYLIDEADSVPDDVHRAIEGNCAGGGYVAMASNPRNPTSVFYEAMAGKEQNRWERFEVSCLENPNYVQRREVIEGLATYEWCTEMKDTWGENSYDYNVNVLGKFQVGEEGRVISYALIESAQLRWPETVASGRLFIGADIAGDGDKADATVTVPRRDQKILEIRRPRGGYKSLPGDVRDIIRTYPSVGGKPVVIFDAQGQFGRDCLNLLRYDAELDKAYEVFPFYWSEKIKLYNHPYETNRDDAWNRFAVWLGEGGALPADEWLAQELRFPTWSRRNLGKHKVSSREEFVKLLGRSPDAASAAILSVCVPSSVLHDVKAPTGRRRDLDEDDDLLTSLRENAMDPFASWDNR